LLPSFNLQLRPTATQVNLKPAKAVGVQISSYFNEWFMLHTKCENAACFVFFKDLSTVQTAAVRATVFGCAILSNCAAEH
jgi:hypothetical protein